MEIHLEQVDSLRDLAPQLETVLDGPLVRGGQRDCFLLFLTHVVVVVGLVAAGTPKRVAVGAVWMVCLRGCEVSISDLLGDEGSEGSLFGERIPSRVVLDLLLLPTASQVIRKQLLPAHSLELVLNQHSLDEVLGLLRHLDV
jgi:hypothetical protein